MDHYFKQKMHKMGKWSLMPADSGSWHGQKSSDEFKKVFGFGKGLLAIHTFEDGYQHMYAPVAYFKKLGQFLDDLKAENPKGIENKFSRFYALKSEARKEIPKLAVDDYSKLSNQELAEKYEQIRSWIHRATIYDQFGWLSEDYWEQPMDAVLVDKLGLEKNSSEYHQVMFALTKPEEISTTLEEKRAVLKKVIEIKEQNIDVGTATGDLANQFGWMPVFAYGDPWNAEHYKTELEDMLKNDLQTLKTEYEKLLHYSKNRNEEMKRIQEQYNIADEDMQIFVDFGLVLDARNEAEYILSFGTYYLLPIYKETARRLNMSVKQVRSLEENEIASGLRGELDLEKLLNERRKIFAWGFDEDMESINFYPEDEALDVFKRIEEHAENAGDTGEERGITGSPGKVTGTVKLIPTPKENHKIETGDILITYATTVDYLPAMKKAAAFVAEVGGLTCHAAVVAREFGVPCIVSYHDAMAKFKDGDIVEVDADNGIIRKLENE